MSVLEKGIILDRAHPRNLKVVSLNLPRPDVKAISSIIHTSNANGHCEFI